MDYALREHAAWYVGDGTYGDGPHFHQDYYNSFVIQPFLLALMDVVGKEDAAWSAMAEGIRVRARRYAAVQERMIGVDGTYPVVGRSIAYRCGAFQLLAEIALRGMLPEEIAPEQVRGALCADGGDAKDIGRGGDFRCEGMVADWVSGASARVGRDVYFDGEFVSLYGCVSAVGVGGGGSLLEWRGDGMERGEGLEWRGF